MTGRRKVAIIGAGFAGLATCYSILNETFPSEVTLFDHRPLGEGTSGIAAGLLHPYPGKDGRLSWQGEEGMKATKELLKVASTELGFPVFTRGIFRAALSEEQGESFKHLAGKTPTLTWWKKKEGYSLLSTQSGLWISSGVTVATKCYLQGLFKACERLGAQFILKEVAIGDLSNYDDVVIAAGAKSLVWARKGSLPLKVNKGQLLMCMCPDRFTLSTSVIGNGYVARDPISLHYTMGSTYEHHFLSEKPCLETAKPLILDRASQFIQRPHLLDIVDCLAGMRAVHTKSYHPIVDRLAPSTWVFTGLGSRGLLYHAYLAKKLARALAEQSRDPLPKEVRIER